MLPEDLWEDFFRAYPKRGERTMVLRKLVDIAVSSAKEKDCFSRAIKEEMESVYGEAD